LAKDYLNLFKRDSLRLLVDEGVLRKPMEYSLESHFVPQLYGQIKFDITNEREHIDNMDNLLNFTMRNSAK
jgi:hypothetical protein